MDRLKNIGLEADTKFLDISPQNSPRPQASSTFMVKGNDSECEKSRDDKKPESSLTIFSTTSSLGMIDIDKESLLSEKEFNNSWNLQQSTPYHQRLISEYQNQSLSQLRKRLDELSFRNSSINSTCNVPPQFSETYNISANALEDKIRTSNVLKTSMNSNASHLISSSSSQIGDFESGNFAVLKLDEDQKENRKMFSSLPVSPMNISENYESADEKEQKFTEFVHMKSYSPKQISDILRNRINEVHDKVVSRLFDKDKFDDQEVISSTTDVKQNFENDSIVPSQQQPPKLSMNMNSEKYEKPIRPSFMDISSINTSLDISCTNSIASLNEIAELLKRQSLMAAPKLAVEELLSLGKSKQKTVNPINRPSSSQPNLNDFSSRDTTLMNASEKNTLRGKAPSYENILSSTVQDDKAIPRNTDPPLNDLSALLSDYASCKENKRAFFIKLPNTSTDTTNKTVTLPRNFVDLNAINDEAFKQNSLSAAPVQRISSNHSLMSTDTTSNEDTIFAGHLCVGTLAEVIVVVENPTKETLKYKICLKSISNDKPTNTPAASIMLASDQDDITFSPLAETEINVMVTPLVEGKIDIILEFISEDKKCSNIIRRIEIISEMPKFQIIQPDTGVVQFGSLNENTHKSIPLVLRNEGSSRLPLKLMLYEDQQTNPTYAKVTINPNETLHCQVCISTSQVTSVTNDTLYLQGKLIIILDTPEGIPVKIPLIRTLLLSARVVKTVLVIDSESPIILKSNGMGNLVTEYLNVRNVSITPLEVTAEIDRSSEFVVEPKYFKLFPHDRKMLEVTFKPNSVNATRDINVLLTIKNMNKRIPVKIIGILDPNMEPSSNVSSPLKSRNQSYKSLASSGSSSGSSVAFDGIMELDSTHSSLSWPSVPLHTRKIQTFTLRNRNPAKEKLLLMISDAHNFYKFVENEQCVKELRLTLESKESRKISVAFTPSIADQPINGKITIVRRNTLESSMTDFQKRVIPLFGVGGSVKMLFSGVFHDNEDRLWINCESHSFETKFIIENVGDAEAFVKIVSEELDDRISPEECTLLPSESIEINYMLHLNTDRLDLLYKQHSHKEVILVNKLIIYSGNESTRLRLKKIWSRNDEFEKMQKIRDKMEILNFDSTSRLRTDSLMDAESVFTKFLYEGITEHTIGVLVPRQNLENVSLDSTVIFKDLTNFTFEHVYNC